MSTIQALRTDLPVTSVFPTERVAPAVALLRRSVEQYGRVVYASSLGAEAMVLTDLICEHAAQIDIFTVDTGRLPEATHQLLERVIRRYGRKIRVLFPEAPAVQNLVADQGINGFYGSVEARRRCCNVRKVEPFRRAIAGYNAWVTGVRHEQSVARAVTKPVEWDERYRLHQINPLLNWTHDDIWGYIRGKSLPYNPLHDQGFPSIGCAPCTRAVDPGQDPRSGRWWWESAESRECGLQPKRVPESLSDL